MSPFMPRRSDRAHRRPQGWAYYRLLPARFVDGVTGAVVVAFALWTLVYDLGLASHLVTSALVAIWAGSLVLATLAAAWYAVTRSPRRAGQHPAVGTAGSSRAGSSRAGSTRAGSSRAGSSRAEPAEAEPAQAEPDEAQLAEAALAEARLAEAALAEARLAETELSAAQPGPGGHQAADDDDPTDPWGVWERWNNWEPWPDPGPATEHEQPAEPEPAFAEPPELADAEPPELADAEHPELADAEAPELADAEHAELADAEPVKRAALASRPVVAAIVVIGLAAAAGAGITAMLNSGPSWGWAWGLAIVAVLAALAWLIVTRSAAQMARPLAQPGGVQARPASLTESLLALGVAIGGAIASLHIVRPNGDDAYYISRSVWVAQHGTIPVNDVIFTNQTVPHIWGEPPISSIEVLIGALARLCGAPAASATYLVALPILTFFAIWAAWMLVRRWAPGRPGLCFCVAMVYLYWGGVDGGTFGAFHLVRMWQGKAAFVSLMVPLVYAYLTDWAERRSGRSLVLVLAAGIAAAGLSSAAVYVLPLVALAAVVPLLVVAVPLLAAARFKIAAGLAGCAVYIVIAGLLVAELSPLAPSTQGGAVSPASVWTSVLVPGVFGAVGGIAVWAGPWLVRRGAPAFLATGVALVATLLILPGLLTLIGEKTNASPVMYRTLWALPVPVLAGLLAAVPLSPARFKVAARLLAPVPAVAVVVALIWSGLPLVSPPLTVWASHPSWKYYPSALTLASEVVAADRHHGDVLAPWQVMAAMPRLTTLVHAVDPREYYLSTGGLPAGAQFVADRLLLTGVADGARPFPPEAQIQAALTRVDVGYVCLYLSNTGGMRRMKRAGFVPGFLFGDLQCLYRGPGYPRPAQLSGRPRSGTRRS